ncbi:acid sphingomyelinase-like phosphodiesterase [Legionella sainthelensi]|uniref:metallophosphoesterase n=1 Tax=Legionella sainthelensi TaxID=28087 RepID=UPI000E1FB9D6|nr:metallophosphoesterase [Legionella sainthelensi]VEB36468.1 acid sphingomyelinase-like phosphodiesterase [Legionella sainthelensi]
MRNKANKEQFVLAVIIYLLSSVAIALPLVTITPQDYTYHDQAVASGTSLTVPYTITNNTPATLYQVMASDLPKGVTSSVCPILISGSSCTLNLTIPASLTKGHKEIRSRFKVCVRKNEGCTLVSSANQLDINILNNSTFIAISDMHVDYFKAPPITYGDDTDLTLWNYTLDKITSLIKEQSPAFIVFTGDVPAHGPWPNVNPNQAQDIMTVLTSLSGLPAISANNLPVFYAFGNNDSLVSDYGEFFDAANNRNLFYLDPTHNWPALNTNPDCSVSPTFACTYTTTLPMPPEHAEDMAHAQSQGYYSAYPLGSNVPFRLISLNSVIFSRDYLPLQAPPTPQLAEAQAEMDWLSNQLAFAEANKESVYIIMHIPVGMDAFYNGDHHDMWNTTLHLNNGLLFRDAFLALMTQYKSTIRAVVSAHTHEDELRALYPDQALMNMEVLDVGVPGVTPNHFNNPGVQVYLYDNTFQLTEAKTYYTTPNPSGWKSYSFQNDYACKKNSTLFSCVSTNILPQLPAWKLEPQPIVGNPYEMNYPVRNSGYNPSPFSSWLAILDTIQVVPIQ